MGVLAPSREPINPVVFRPMHRMWVPVGYPHGHCPVVIQWNDACNAIAEGVGGAMLWWNVYKLYRHKTIRGIAWQTEAYGLGWCVWHLIYYTSLDQWLSFCGEVIGTVAVITWLAMAWVYRKGPPIDTSTLMGKAIAANLEVARGG